MKERDRAKNRVRVRARVRVSLCMLSMFILSEHVRQCGFFPQQAPNNPIYNHNAVNSQQPAREGSTPKSSRPSSGRKKKEKDPKDQPSSSKEKERSSSKSRPQSSKRRDR